MVVNGQVETSAFVCAFMLVFALVFQSIPPLVGFLVADLGITHAQAGALMSLLAYRVFHFDPRGGILSDLHGAKRVGGLQHWPLPW